MKAIGGAWRLGVFGESFGVVCEGMGMSDKCRVAGSQEGSSGLAFGAAGV